MILFKTSRQNGYSRNRSSFTGNSKNHDCYRRERFSAKVRATRILASKIRLCDAFLDRRTKLWLWISFTVITTIFTITIDASQTALRNAPRPDGPPMLVSGVTIHHASA
jgi:hypothetical protein